jgi:hypothetical protein
MRRAQCRRRRRRRTTFCSVCSRAARRPPVVCVRAARSALCGHQRFANGMACPEALQSSAWLLHNARPCPAARGCRHAELAFCSWHRRGAIGTAAAQRLPPAPGSALPERPTAGTLVTGRHHSHTTTSSFTSHVLPPLGTMPLWLPRSPDRACGQDCTEDVCMGVLSG